MDWKKQIENDVYLRSLQKIAKARKITEILRERQREEKELEVSVDDFFNRDRFEGAWYE